MGFLDRIINGSTSSSLNGHLDAMHRIEMDGIETRHRIAIDGIKQREQETKDFQKDALIKSTEAEKSQYKAIYADMKQQNYDLEAQYGALNCLMYRPFAEIAQKYPNFKERFDSQISELGKNMLLKDAFISLAKEYGTKLGIDDEQTIDNGFKKAQLDISEENFDNSLNRIVIGDEFIFNNNNRNRIGDIKKRLLDDYAYEMSRVKNKK